MSDDPPDSLIPYDAIVQEALRAVVGRVLGEIEQTGGELPGEHHFYITFKTDAAGVDIPADLRARFPDEMTIVLQHKFWDLSVSDQGFSVGLSFNGVGSILTIPFAAITAFVDPAVDFGLQFQATSEDDELDPQAPAGNDGEEREVASRITSSEDGSNVVSVDFGKKKAEREFARADVEAAAVALSQDENDRVHTALSLYLKSEEARELAAVRVMVAVVGEVVAVLREHRTPLIGDDLQSEARQFEVAHDFRPEQ